MKNEQITYNQFQSLLEDCLEKYPFIKFITDISHKDGHKYYMVTLMLENQSISFTCNSNKDEIDCRLDILHGLTDLAEKIFEEKSGKK